MSMDAVEFIKTKKRLCHSVSCRDCPIFERKDKANLTCIQWFEAHPEETVSIVEQWANEHPRKTRQSEFLKQWPNAKMPSGQLIGCPQYVEEGYHPPLGCSATRCTDCRREFWMQEVE